MKNSFDKYKKVAVIGCGFIGYSWGVAFARKGLETWMYNRPSKTLDTVKERSRTDAYDRYAAQRLSKLNICQHISISSLYFL